MNTEKKIIRQEMLQKRRCLSVNEQTLAAEALSHQLFALPEWARSRRIGAYLAMGSELSLAPFMHHPLNQDKAFFVPQLPAYESKMLLACPWSPTEPLTQHALGFSQPAALDQSVPWWTLDLLLVPLLAFDHTGARLGRGGGFYDMLLKSLYIFSKRPLCLGVAFDFQAIKKVPMVSHDMPLDGVVTPTQRINTNVV